MLGKLIKHEFKATARIFLPLFGAYLAAVILFQLFKMILNNADFPIIYLLYGAISIVSSLLGSAIFLFPIISSVMRFRKNILGDEGYLMNTLPISTNKLLISKVTISLCWVVLSSIALAISDIIININNVMDDGIFTFFQSQIDLPQYWYDNPLLIVLLIVTVITFACSTILMLYSSICLGHLANTGRTIKAILSFIGLIFGVLVVLTLILPGFNRPLAHSNWNEVEFTNFILWLCIIFNLIFGAVFYFITQRVLTKRLNIQ